MGLEVADWIDELISANPTVADPVSQGDDHIRLVKQVLKNAFPGNTAAGTFDGPWTIGGATPTINGRDLAVDGAKLDGIEAGAEANPTAAETKTIYESNADTNAYTDADQATVARISAYGQMLSGTTFFGVGIAAVSTLTTGEHRIDYVEAATGFDKQVAVFTGDQQSIGSNGFYHVDAYNENNSRSRVYGRTAVSASVTNTTKFPIGVIRFIFP